MVLFLWRCASAPPPPPPPEPVVKKLESPPVIPPSPPRGIKIQSVTYDRYEMVIEWEKSADVEFGSYRLLQSIVGGKDSDTILVTRDINQTNFVLEKFDEFSKFSVWLDLSSC